MTPLPHRAAAAAFVPTVPASIADELRVAYLGWQLPPAPVVPPIPRPVSAPADELVDLAARLFGVVDRQLTDLEDGRRLLPPVVESAP